MGLKDVLTPFRRRPEPTAVPQIVVGWKAVAISLVRSQGLHEGIWRVALKFAPPIGLNMKIESQPNMGMVPAAVLPVAELLLVKDESVHELSVDAAVCNPRPAEAVN